MQIGNITISNDKPFTLIAGPCSMESKEHAFEMAHRLVEMCSELSIPLIYKSSFDKANRTSINSNRGIGIDKALDIFAQLKEKFGFPVISDVHTEEQCKHVSEIVDVLQIPAFLCRQTDLLIAAAKTNCAINVKKGQFLSPYDMKHVVKKIKDTGNNRVMVCDRGTSFGYNTLVTDFRGLVIMKNETNCPVVFDATHSVQMPGGSGETSGGQREFAPILAKAALAVGAAALFIETHDDPDNAISDGPNMIPIDDLKGHLEIFKQIDAITKHNI